MADIFLFTLFGVIIFSAIFILIIPDFFESYSHKVRSKKIVEVTNKKGRKYYELLINNKSYGLKMSLYDDALFLYNNLIKIGNLSYIYESICEHPYRKLILKDDVKIDFVSYCVNNNVDDSYHYDKLKNVFFGDSSWRHYKSINSIYDNLHYSVKTILSSKDNIDDKIESAVNNSDIQKLKEIVNEYKETVNLQNAMTNMLVKICESDKKYSKK